MRISVNDSLISKVRSLRPATSRGFVEQRDTLGRGLEHVYDVRNSLREVDESPTMSDPNSDPNKIVTRYTYDNLGNLQRVLRAAGDS